VLHRPVELAALIGQVELGQKSTCSVTGCGFSLFWLAGVILYYFVSAELLRGRKVIGRLNAAWRFLIIVGLLFVMVETPFPLSSRHTSLTFASPSYQKAQDFNPQQPNSELAALHVSEPFRIASFPASVWFDAHWPTWAHGYFAQLSEGNFPAGLTVYDRTGKQKSTSYVSIPGGTGLWLIGAIPTSDGGAVASGQVAIDDGTTYFLAETSPSGGVVSTLRTDTF
jgi:hypothetical protein